MERPDWLSGGATVWDPDGDRWLVQSVDARWVHVENPDRGRHRLRRRDLVKWVESGDWETTRP